MRISIKPIRILDEYLYKYAFMLLGLLYWVYGCTSYMLFALNCLVVISVLPCLSISIRNKKADFRVILGGITLIFGLFTVALSDFKKPTLTALLYSVLKMLLLGYCASHKNSLELEREFKSLCRLMVVLGTVILIVSLSVYFAGMSIPYYLDGHGTVESTVMYVGMAKAGEALCGVLANANLAGTFCVIYLGCLLTLLDTSKRKIIGYAMIALDLLMLILTESRGSLLGAIMIIGIYFWFKFKESMSGSHTKRLLRWTIICLTTSILVAYIAFGGSINIFAVLNRSEMSMESSTETRFVLWLTAITATLSSVKNALFGVGAKINTVMRAYCPVSFRAALYTNVHNAYLQKALQFGIPSAIMMILYFMIILSAAFKSLSSAAKKDMFVVVLLGLVCALLVINLVESDMLSKTMEGTFIWIFSGYLYAFTRSKSNEIPWRKELICAIKQTR